MTMEGRLDDQDDRLYVLYTYDEQGEPFRRRMWWRVLETRGTGYGERPEAGDLATWSGDGQWRTRNPSTHRTTGTVSTGTGSTTAAKVDRLAILPPAVGKKELRWRNGRWEKLLAKGWVPAGEGRASPATAPRKKSARRLDAEIREALADDDGKEG